VASRSNRDTYTQLAIGDCGHVVQMWPVVTDLGGANPRVICDDCTKEQYGIARGEQFVIVRVRQPDKSKPKPRKSTPRKPKPLSPFQQLLKQEGLF